MNCIRCDRNLPRLNDNPDCYQPVGGTEFITQGHLASTVTNADGTVHIINICDNCLGTAIERGDCIVVQVVETSRKRRRMGHT